MVRIIVNPASPTNYLNGRTYRLLVPIRAMGPNALTFEPGTIYRLVWQHIDYLDWFCSVIEVDGQTHNVREGVWREGVSEEVQEERW